MSDKQKNSETNIREDERIEGESKKEARGGGFLLFFGYAAIAAGVLLIALSAPPLPIGITIVFGLICIFKDKGTKKDSGSAASKATPRVTVDRHPRDANGIPHHDPSTRLTNAQTASLKPDTEPQDRHTKPNRYTEQQQRRKSM